MNINVLTLILILFFSSCSSDKEIKTYISTSDDVSLYNLAMKNLKKRNYEEAIDIVNQLIEVETGTKEESDIDTMLELENEMSRGK